MSSPVSIKIETDLCLYRYINSAGLGCRLKQKSLCVHAYLVPYVSTGSVKIEGKTKQRYKQLTVQESHIKRGQERFLSRV